VDTRTEKLGKKLVEKPETRIGETAMPGADIGSLRGLSREGEMKVRRKGGGGDEGKSLLRHSSTKCKEGQGKRKKGDN